MLLNSVGMMGEVVVLGWLSLELTNSPFLVGVAMSMRALPLFFIGAPAGALADRFSRRRLLMVTGVGQALTAGTLGTLALLGLVAYGHLLVLTLTAGMLRGLEHAARQSYTHDVVGAPALMRGLAVLGIGMRSGWLVGSLGAGAIIAHFGSGAAYLAVALGFLAGGLALLPASEESRRASPNGESVWKSVLGFAQAVRTDSRLLTLMVLTAGAEVLGFSHQALLPSLARDVLAHRARRPRRPGRGALGGRDPGACRRIRWRCSVGRRRILRRRADRLRREHDRPRARARRWWGSRACGSCSSPSTRRARWPICSRRACCS